MFEMRNVPRDYKNVVAHFSDQQASSRTSFSFASIIVKVSLFLI